MPLPRPAVSVLNGLDDDAWARLVGHARRSMRELDQQPRDELGEVAGASTVELLTGPGRQALAVQLAAGGPLWEQVAARLTDEDAAGWEEALTPDDRDPSAPGERIRELEAAHRQDVAQLKERIRELTGQRDQARRQAVGADVRATAAEDKVAAAAEELAAARDRIAELERRLDRAADDRDSAVERVRRQYQGELNASREQLRAVRRAEEERRAEQRRRAEAEQAAQRAAAQSEQAARRAARTGRQGAQPGRPSRLPGGVQPGTLAAARALLTPEHRVLVDGYNLTLKHRGHLDLEQQRAALIATLEAAATRFRCDFHVLFDSRHGSPVGAPRSRSIRVRFTEPGVTADDEIVFDVSAAPEDQPLLVVTDDRELRDRVRPHGVDVLATGEFLRAVE